MGAKVHLDCRMLKHTFVVVAAVTVSLLVAKGLAAYDPAAPATVAHADLAAAAIAPEATAGATAPPAAAEIVKGRDGHYWAEAEVNGRWLHCLVDTGATVVALRPQDALRLGLDPATLVYDTRVNTANGQTRAARIELDHVSVADARVDHVPAMVVESGLAAPLLGMSYLGRLSGFEATPRTLILRP